MNETPVLTDEQKERLIRLGVTEMVRSAVRDLEGAMSHFKQQLTIAAGMYNYHRFRSDLESLQVAKDRFAEALELQESLSGGKGMAKPTDGPDTTREEQAGRVHPVADAGTEQESGDVRTLVVDDEVGQDAA